MWNTTHKQREEYKSDGTRIVHPDYERYTIGMMRQDLHANNPRERYSTAYSMDTYDIGEKQAEGGFFICQTIEKDEHKVSLNAHYEEKNTRQPIRIRLTYPDGNHLDFRYDKDKTVYIDRNGTEYTIEQIRKKIEQIGFNLKYSDALCSQFIGNDKRIKPPIPPIISDIVKKYDKQVKDQYENR